MASATGIPDRIPAEAEANGHDRPAEEVGDDEPLLGRRGDASQPEGKALYYNLIIGTSPSSPTCLPYLTRSRHSSSRTGRYHPPRRLRLGQCLPERPNSLLRTPTAQQRRHPLPHARHPHPATNTYGYPETSGYNCAFYAQQLGHRFFDCWSGGN